ncbi:MAG: amine oxidase, partial [Pseudomonadota bacterium]
LGAPLLAPGKARAQSTLDGAHGRVLLAGDYLEFPNLEAAVASGMEAAKQARGLLADGRSAAKSD